MSQEELEQGQPPNSRGDGSTAVVLPALLLYAKTISVILRQGIGCGCRTLPTAPADPHLACCAQVTSNSGNAISPAARVKGVGGAAVLLCPPPGSLMLSVSFPCQRNKTLESCVLYDEEKKKKVPNVPPGGKKKDSIFCTL